MKLTLNPHPLKNQNPDDAALTRQLSVLGSYMGTKTELRTVLKLVEQGWLKPVVDKVWPLHDCIVAHHYLEHDKQFGKVVLAIS
jgi:zinc-binding alcohol dehydrogenase/oxidoreductase